MRKISIGILIAILFSILFFSFFSDVGETADHIVVEAPGFLTELSLATPCQRSTLARTSNGNLHAVYLKDMGDEVPAHDVFYSVSDDDGATWTETQLTNTGYNEWEPSIVSDSEDRLYVFWSSPNDAFARRQIMYKIFNQTWKQAFNLTYNETYDQSMPSIAVNSTDAVHVTWSGDTADAYSVDYAYSTSLSGTGELQWSELYNVTTSGPGGGYHYTSLAIDSDDVVHFVWTYGNWDWSEYSHIQYCSFDGSSFSEIEDVNTQDGSDTYFSYAPSIIVNSSDVVHITWVNYTESFNTTMQHRSYDGISWSSIQNFSSDFTPLPTHGTFWNSLSYSTNGTTDVLQAVWGVVILNETEEPNGGVMSYANYTTTWSPVVNLTANVTNKTGPCLLYGNYPVISSVKTNVPKKGFCFLYMNETENISYFSSDDLEFDIPEIPPSLSDENPSSGETGVSISLSQVNITITDNAGDPINWTIGGQNITTNSSTNDDNGIKNATIIGPLKYMTTYSWWVNASDNDGYRNESYSFTTEIHHEAVVYVDDGYTEFTSGWHVNKYDSINDALQAVNVSGTIYVYPGAYNENLVVNKTLNLTGIAGAYGVNRDSIIIDGSGAGNTIRVTANKVNISYLRIQNGDYGIYLDHVNNGSIMGCNFTNNNKDGAFFSYSNDTLIKDNNFSGNGWAGLNISEPLGGGGSFNNIIYHNNFINNGVVNAIGEIIQTWNASYPYGGNYWSDYWWSFDNYSGPSQNYTGGDGIGDEPQDISRVTWDYYPLFTPWYLGNHPPYVYNANPFSGKTNIPITQADVRVTIIDDEGDAFNWSLESQYITNVYITGATDGVKTVPIATSLPYFEFVYWYVNVTDGEGWTNKTYFFETQSQSIDIIKPNGSTTTVGLIIQDAITAAFQGDTIYIYAGNYTENIIINKAIILLGENVSTTAIKGGGAGDTISVTSDDVQIRNLTIRDSGVNGAPNYDSGIDARNRDNVTCYGLNLTNNRNGMYLNTVTNSYIMNSTFYANSWGIYADSSSSNNISNNTIRANLQDGIYLSGCDNNRVANNTIENNIDNGIETVTICEDNVYVYNTIRNHVGKRNIFLIDELRPLISHNSLSESLDGLTLYSCDFATVQYNTFFSNTQTGIDLWDHTDDSLIRGNNISGNDNHGIRIYFGSSNNQIYENNIHGMDYLNGIPNAQDMGLYIRPGAMTTCENNFIYHNNFFSNVEQVRDNETTGINTWNDTYPSGGNYYDDFDEESEGAGDKYQGPGQDILGADGICDSHSPAPYNVSGLAGSQDHYPLKNPYGPTLMADFNYMPRNPQTYQKITFTDVSTGYIISYAWTFGDGTSATGKTVSHFYQQEDFYTVTLRITDNRGISDTVSKIISVGSNVVSIPPLKPPKYPNTPFTVPEMYELLRATVKNEAKVILVVIDSGTTTRTYDSVDLTPVISMNHPVYYDGGDAFGHGTWVNYCIRYGIQTFTPNCIQYSIKAFDEKGQCSPETFLGALDMAKSLNPDIVTISAGIFGTSDDKFCQKVSELRTAGIFVTVSAGNEGPTASTITSPASGSDSIAVGAENPLQTNGVKSILDLSDDVVCDFSSRGPVEGISPKPDFVCPGESIIGPWLSEDKVASGTSMAAPFMASGAVQVIGTNKQLFDIVRFIYGGKVYLNIIESSFVDSTYEKGEQNDYGWGIPNVELAVKIAWIKAMYALIVFIIAVSAIIVTVIIVYRLSKGKRKSSSSSMML